MNSFKSIYWLLSVALLSLMNLNAQENFALDERGSLPKVTHYSRDDFHADSQFWTMTRDQEGILYFGNNDGVLIFDGERWQKVVLPNHSSVRSLTTTKAGKIYAGGFNDLGVIEKDSVGNYHYVSQVNDLELENGKLENLWQVHEFKNYIIFRSFSELIVIAGNTATHISSNNAFTYSDIVNNKYYVQDSGHGILEFDPENMQLNKVFASEDYDHNEIKAFLPYDNNNEVALISKNGKVYIANSLTGTLKLWKRIFADNYQDQVITAIEHNDKYLLGTLSSKILILTKKGEVIHDSLAFANVHNSSVLDLHHDGENIWALLNNGLDFIEFDSPVSQLFKDASIYDILLDENKVFLATNKGVFSSNLSVEDVNSYNFRFDKVPNLEGQAWSIQKEEDAIIIGHDKGLFHLKDGVPEKIGNVDGFWKIIKIEGTPEKYLAANYNGLYLINKSEKGWNLQHKIKGFEESTRDILQADEKNTFWVCHGFKGVYKLKINEDYTRIYAVDHYTNQNGLESPFNVNVTRWNNDVVFTTNTGIFHFNESSNYFEPYTPLNNILDTAYNTRKIVKDNERIWIVQDDQIGYFNQTDENPEIRKNIFLNLKGSLNRGMESIQPLQNNNVLIGATTGLYLYELKGAALKKIRTRITGANYLKKAETQKINIDSENDINLPPGVEILRFEFTAPGVSPSSLIQYQYFLEGIDEKWSAWETSAFKEYTHLPAGNYSFGVRSRDLTGNEGEEAKLAFIVSPVWYQTTTAYIIYGVMVLLLAILVIQLVRRKIELERKKAEIASQKTKKLLELEIEQLKLEKDKESIKRDKQLLEEDNILKSKELANYTMMLVKKKDVFSETYENLLEFRKSLKTQAAKKRLQDVLMKLNQHRIGEEYMTIFDVNFEKVHKNFFRELKNINPKLTKRELRLCAFVKMNLTNKEIAPLLNISVRGVETARYRVRKKLNVQESNFITFLENLSNPVSI